MDEKTKKIIVVSLVVVFLVAGITVAICNLAWNNGNGNTTNSNYPSIDDVSYKVYTYSPSHTSSGYSTTLVIEITSDVKGHLFLKDGDEMIPVRHSESEYKTSYNIPVTTHDDVYYNSTTRTYSDIGTTINKDWQTRDMYFNWKETEYQYYSLGNNCTTFSFKDTSKSYNHTIYNEVQYTLPFSRVSVYEELLSVEQVSPYNYTGIFANKYCSIAEDISKKTISYTHSISSSTLDELNTLIDNYKEMLKNDVFPRLLWLNEEQCDQYLAEKYVTFVRTMTTCTH